MDKGEKMKKTYTVVLEKDENGKYHLRRVCDGFSPLELLGLLEFIQLEIKAQMAGDIKPDIVKREVVENGLGEEKEK